MALAGGTDSYGQVVCVFPHKRALQRHLGTGDRMGPSVLGLGRCLVSSGVMASLEVWEHSFLEEAG